MEDLLFSEGPIRALQSFLSPLLDGFFLIVTNAGVSVILLTLSLIIYWLADKRLGLFLGLLALSSAALNGFLKDLFQMPRPPSYLQKGPAYGYGFPSGHAQLSTSFWSATALSRRGAWVVVAPLIIALVALSRVYLGVHYVGDVLGGIAFGMSISLAGLVAYKVGFWGGLDMRYKLLLAVLLPSLPMAALSLMGQNVVMIWGLLLGIAVGYVLEEEWIGLGRPQRVGAVSIRLASGLPSMAVLYGVSLFLSAPLDLFLIHLALGLVATLLLPWVFSRLESSLIKGRAEKEQG